MSCTHGTSSHTMVHFSSETVLIIDAGSVPLSSIPLLPEMRLPNQCIFAPV